MVLRSLLIQKWRRDPPGPGLISSFKRMHALYADKRINARYIPRICTTSVIPRLCCGVQPVLPWLVPAIIAIVRCGWLIYCCKCMVGSLAHLRPTIVYCKGRMRLKLQAGTASTAKGRGAGAAASADAARAVDVFVLHSLVRMTGLAESVSPRPVDSSAPNAAHWLSGRDYHQNQLLVIISKNFIDKKRRHVGKALLAVAILIDSSIPMSRGISWNGRIARDSVNRQLLTVSAACLCLFPTWPVS